jgi:alkanesulfonate monooxygenase SsuD/methylene tetrahydromethanopterin reductase-like flavin-dependent oxidoreductase (luciferase family)
MSAARAASGLEVGVFVPQGWKLEYTGWSGPDAWARSVELAETAESLGYDHLWVYDHVETVPRREPTHCFEAFTMLAALSQRTSRVGLGQLVTCSSYRNAGLLAKEAACIDVFSAGRLILGLGAGWFHEEYHSYGYEYLSDRERLAVLDETIEVVTRLWREEQVTFDGKHLHFDGAFCDPKPVQQPPPVLVGGGGEKVNLRIAAARADFTNWQVSLEAFERKSRLLEQYCDEVSRSFVDIVRTHGPDCRLFDT